MLEWVGLLPGKRESRRYIGKYTVTQNDVESGGNFEDIVAYGGWSMDDHFPAGIEHKTSYPTIFHPAPSPWGIPFRALCSRNIENLLFAGRNISVTHAALSSSRVMATCSLLGQAVGTAAAQMILNGENTENINIEKLQKTLMDEDCWLPGKNRSISKLSLDLNCSGNIVINGKERGDENLWKGKEGDYLEYSSDKPFKLTGIRIVFDSDLNRDYQNMPCCIRLEENRFKLPETLIKNFDILLKHADGNTKVYHFHNNHLRFRKLDIQGEVLSVKFCRLKPMVQKHLIFIILKCFKSGKNPSRKLKSIPKLHENMILTRTQRRTNKQQEKRRGITPRLTLNLQPYVKISYGNCGKAVPFKP